MPIDMVLTLDDGWKKDDNDRFGSVLIVNFVNKATNQVLFKYAPKLEDKEKFEKMFKLLFEYDMNIKKIREGI